MRGAMRRCLQKLPSVRRIGVVGAPGVDGPIVAEDVGRHSSLTVLHSHGHLWHRGGLSVARTSMRRVGRGNRRRQGREADLLLGATLN